MHTLIAFGGNHMKIPKKIFGVLFVVCLSVIIVMLIPVKKAVMDSKHDNCVLIKWQQTTGEPWIRVDCENQYDNELHLEGKYMYNLPLGVLQGDNTYWIYGSFGDQVENVLGEKVNTFDVESWDIQYPIKRNSLFAPFLSDKYLYLYELFNW